MKNAVLEEIALSWENMAAMEENAKPGRRETLRECADLLRMGADNPLFSKRETGLEELVRSACAIAERKGAGTAWGRFVASARSFGLNGVTARTYRILPSDIEDRPVSALTDEQIIELHDSMFPRVAFDPDLVMGNVVKFARALLVASPAKVSEPATEAPTGQSALAETNLDVLARSYHWALTIDGKLMGLTAGDLHYEDTGIALDGSDLVTWKYGCDCMPPIAAPLTEAKPAPTNDQARRATTTGDGA